MRRKNDMMKDDLGDRMKRYEEVSSLKLVRRMPTIIRLDGKAFHTYTKGADRPYDKTMERLRLGTMQYLMNNIQGAFIGYAQSDEISIVLKDWTNITSEAWFGNKVQKICSVSASMCTAVWNSLASEEVGFHTGKLAMFDARCFNIPKEEVVNYLIWRQQDAERNSIQMLAQSLYSHKQLQGISCNELITKIECDHGIVWGELPSDQKRGTILDEDGDIVDSCFINIRDDINEDLN